MLNILLHLMIKILHSHILESKIYVTHSYNTFLRLYNKKSRKLAVVICTLIHFWVKYTKVSPLSSPDWPLRYNLILFSKILLKLYLTYYNLKTGDCSFHYGLQNCQWNNVDLVDNFNWTVHSGPTGSYATGPSNDRRGSTTGMQL